MNGTSGAQDAHTNGAGHSQAGLDASTDAKIIQALELIHSPQTSNQHRQEAFRFLEEIKAHDEAPYHGFLLASSKSNDAIIRHFGLSLLESAIRYSWSNYAPEQSATVRNWVLQLTQGISDSDPAFLRNKVAQLWVEVTKRSWMVDWWDMDELLVKLWQGGPIEKYFVLEVLETLSDCLFGKDLEDSVTLMRSDDLSNACVDIWTPADVFKEHFPKRDDGGVRHGQEGWLLRIAEFLTWCMGQDLTDATVSACAIKAAATLKSALDWVLMKAVIAIQLPARLCQALLQDSTSLQLMALEGLYVLYSRRAQMKPDDIAELVIPMLAPDNVRIFRRVYDASRTDPNDIDDAKYLITKKITPFVFQLGLVVEDQGSFILDHVDLEEFLGFLVTAVQDPSLHVSIPILHLWALFMASTYLRQSPGVVKRAPQLLQICSERLLRYEDLPADSDVPALSFLDYDVETAPEKHQFLGNYSRFAREVIDGIVHQQPAGAIEHLLGQTDKLIVNLYNEFPAFEKSKATRVISPPALRLDAQASVIEACVFGYAKWRTDVKFGNSEDDSSRQHQASIDAALEAWMMTLFSRHFDDPSVEQRYISIIVSLATGPLRKSASAVRAAFQYLIEAKRQFMQPAKLQDMSFYFLHVQDFQRYCSHQLQRLTTKGPDLLVENYSAIESQLQQYCDGIDPGDEDRERAMSVLFIILQRASQVSDSERMQKLESFITPCLTQWSDTSLAQALQNLESFCDFIGISGFQEEYMKLHASSAEDWSEVELDENGRQLRARIETTRQKLPLRLTRTLLGASLDRADDKSIAVAKALWSPHVATILPHIISMIRLVISFSEPSTWEHTSRESQANMKRIMRDRFWQIGISSGTRDDFYNKVTASRGTLEGLASAIRGCIRDVRETCFKCISLLTFLGDALYQFEELPQPLCEALYSHPNALSLHQTVALLEVSRAIIEGAPEKRKPAFLQPIITSLFNYLDQKISQEWEGIEHKNLAASENDDLTEEMKGESILRNLTFNAVLLVARIFDPRPNSAALARQASGVTVTEQQLKANRLDLFVFSNPQVFKSIILFCTHALRMHDSRSCSYIVRVVRSILPVFSLPTNDEEQLVGQNGATLDWMNSLGIPKLPMDVSAEIREFMCTEVLKACITSIHDPYFVDIQNDLASLIGKILFNYNSLTSTPKDILLTLPDITAEKVDQAVFDLIVHRHRSSGHQKKTVLKLLAGLRGVSVAEQGRILQTPPKRPLQDPALGKYTQGEVSVKEERRNDEDDAALDGVAAMFQEGR